MLRRHAFFYIYCENILPLHINLSSWIYKNLFIILRKKEAGVNVKNKCLEGHFVWKYLGMEVFPLITKFDNLGSLRLLFWNKVFI